MKNPILSSIFNLLGWTFFSSRNRLVNMLSMWVADTNSAQKGSTHYTAWILMISVNSITQGITIKCLMPYRNIAGIHYCFAFLVQVGIYMLLSGIQWHFIFYIYSPSVYPQPTDFRFLSSISCFTALILNTGSRHRILALISLDQCHWKHNQSWSLIMFYYQTIVKLTMLSI